MQNKRVFTLKKLVLALALAGYTMGSAYAVLTPNTGTIQGAAPVLTAPSSSTAHAVDLTSNAAGTTLATGDTITLTYKYDDTDGDGDASTTHVDWYYVTGGGDVPIAAENVVNTPATAPGSNGTSVMTIPGAALGATAIKVVIQEYSESGAPISGQIITVADTGSNSDGTSTPPGPVAPGGGVTPGIYLSTDTAFASNLIGSSVNLEVGKTYVFKLWDSAGVGTTDLTGSVSTYNWRLTGASATGDVTAPTEGIATGVADGNFTVPVNSAATYSGSVDGVQGFSLAVDYN